MRWSRASQAWTWPGSSRVSSTVLSIPTTLQPVIAPEGVAEVAAAHAFRPVAEWVPIAPCHDEAVAAGPGDGGEDRRVQAAVIGLEHVEQPDVEHRVEGRPRQPLDGRQLERVGDDERHRPGATAPAAGRVRARSIAAPATSTPVTS